MESNRFSIYGLLVKIVTWEVEGICFEEEFLKASEEFEISWRVEESTGSIYIGCIPDYYPDMTIRDFTEFAKEEVSRFFRSNVGVEIMRRFDVEAFFPFDWHSGIEDV